MALLTRRLYELHDLLCGSSESFEEVDLGSMVSREPALLTAPVADMQRRLLLMRLTARQANIIALVQREPWLLVEGPLTWDQVRGVVWRVPGAVCGGALPGSA